jgi:serine/threonine-protein kinase HipA
MHPSCTIQLHANGAWHDVASVSLSGPASAGWRCPSYSGYAVDWAFRHQGATDAHALCARWPVGIEPLQAAHWPGFLIDLLPQGFGRRELLRRLGLSPISDAAADWELVLAGAGNPIGNLRVKEAAEWLEAHAGSLKGFTDDEVAERGEDFAEHLASHGLFVAGSSGVQGEWPKILLTRADDGLLYLDHSLPDQRAVEHYIVKFGRGPDPQLASILRHEAPYMRIAALLGLKVHAPLQFRTRALFIRRFDRVVEAGTVKRLAQESIATLTGLPGFDIVPSHDQVCRELIRHCTHPQVEILEYLKRDIANLALGNKDNHARNTAIQRDFDGRIALTPVYDFAPMYLHPDGIARRIRWENNDEGRPDWHRVIERVCQIAGELREDDRRHDSGKARDRPELTRAPLVTGLRALAPVLERIASDGESLGIEPEVLAHLRPGLLREAGTLRKLR